MKENITHRGPHDGDPRDMWAAQELLVTSRMGSGHILAVQCSDLAEGT